MNDRTNPHEGLRSRGVSVVYGGVAALTDVDFDLLPGEVHALAGENGAGKSSLVRALGGAVTPHSGTVTIDGRPRPGTVHATETAGVVVIHQEPLDFPDLTVAETIFLGREPMRGPFIDARAMHARAARELHALGAAIDTRAMIADLRLAERQLVAIARALAADGRYLIFDEPTASLSEHEARALHALIRDLAARGKGVLLVTHRMHEIFALATRASVLVDGRAKGTWPIGELTEDALVKKMVGRDVQVVTEERSGPASRDVLLDVRGLGARGRFDDVTFSVATGEIVGLFGLVGAGRSEIAAAIAGIEPFEHGTLSIAGRRVGSRDPGAVRRAGLVLAPEDRRGEGLVLSLSIADNLALVGSDEGDRARRYAPEETARAERAIRDFGVKAPGPSAAAGTLSGGNQQKVLLAKWLGRAPKVVILDEPTRGVDVGAKAEIHALVRRTAAEGAAVLVISSDVNEIRALSNRILLACGGTIVASLPGDATAEEILSLAMPSARTEASK